VVIDVVVCERESQKTLEDEAHMTDAHISTTQHTQQTSARQLTALVCRSV